MARLQRSFLALQHDNTCLRTAANDHSALLSTLREQLVEKAGRVLQLEECLVDQERQLAALSHRTKVSHTLCLHLATLPTALNPLQSALHSPSRASTASWWSAWERWRLKGRPSASPCSRARISAVMQTRQLRSRRGRSHCCASSSQPKRYSISPLTAHTD